MEEKKEKRKSICVSVKPADIKANENLEQSIQTRCRIGSIRTNPPPLVGSHKVLFICSIENIQNFGFKNI